MPGQDEYLKEHYEQMSVINNNVFNMFMLSEYDGSWTTLPKNTELVLNKDYAIVRFNSTNEDEFPLMEIDRTYNFDGISDGRLWTKVKPDNTVISVLYYKQIGWCIRKSIRS